MYPVKSFVKNIGADRSGVHTKKTNKFSVDLNNKEYKDYLLHYPEINIELLKNFQDFFSKKSISRLVTTFIIMKNLIIRILNSTDLIASPPVLVDIGASGQLHKKWNLIAKHSICIAFDADEREFGFIEKEQSTFKKLFVYNCIVSDEDRYDQPFYLTKSPFCSSILKPDLNNLANYSFANIFKTINTLKLKTISISTALNELNIKQVDWFKTDSQGLDLRLFKNLNKDISEKIIVAEFEPRFN